MKPVFLLMILLGVCLTVAGAGLMLFFGSVAYDLVNKPEDVKIVTFVMGNIADMKDAPTFSGTVDGKAVSFDVAKPVKIFGLVYLFILGLNLVFGVPRALLDAGTNMLKTFFPLMMAQPDTPPSSVGKPPGGF